MFSILGAILAIGLLIIVHEAGHYFVARWCKMRVDRFSLGMGPAIYTWRHDETDFTLAPIPFGGFVLINGMMSADEVDPDDPSQYPNRPVWQRFATIFAGPATNYLTAILFALILFSVAGLRTGTTWYVIDHFVNNAESIDGLKRGDKIISVNDQSIDQEQGQKTLLQLVQDSKGVEMRIVVERKDKQVSVLGIAHLNEQQVLIAIGGTTWFVIDNFVGDVESVGGLQRGDKIISVNDRLLYVSYQGQPQKTLLQHVQDSKGSEMRFVVEREGKQVSVVATPKKRAIKYKDWYRELWAPYPGHLQEHQFLLGIDGFIFEDEPRESVGIFRSIKEAFIYPVRQTKLIGKGLYDIVTGRQKGELSGPIGIGTIAKKSFDAGWIAVFNFMMVLNVYLGLFNLLPLPALDGGRLVFLGYEMATRRRANPKVEAMVHMVGIMVLMVVMVLVTYKDIAKLF